MSFADQVQRCPQVQYRLIPVLDNNIRDDIIELDDEAAKSIFFGLHIFVTFREHAPVDSDGILWW